MKKIMAGLIISTTLSTSLGLYHNEAFASKNDENAVCPKMNYIEKILTPKINDNVLLQMNNGKYNYKGIKLNDKVSDVKSLIGKYSDQKIYRTVKGLKYSLNYYDNSFEAFSNNRYINPEQAKIKEMNFNANHPLLQSKVDAVLGKPSKEIITDGGIKTATYNHLQVNYININNNWTTSSYTMFDTTYKKYIKVRKSNIKPGKYKNIKIEAFTDDQLKQMKENTFKFKGVRPGMSEQQVYKLMGESKNSFHFYADRYHYMSQDYGNYPYSGMRFNYRSTSCNGKYKLESIIFSYNDANQTMSNIVKAIGETKRGAYEPPTRSYIYKNHLIVSAIEDIDFNQQKVKEILYRD